MAAEALLRWVWSTDRSLSERGRVYAPCAVTSRMTKRPVRFPHTRLGFLLRCVPALVARSCFPAPH